MTASPEFASVSKLVDLARQLRHTDISNIRFITVPSTPYDVPQGDPRWGRVRLLPGAKKLWRHVTHDEPLSKSLSEQSISAGAPSGGTTAPASPSGTPSGTATPGAPAQSPTATSGDAAAKEAARYGLCA